MVILYGLLLFGSLNKGEFREKTDWPSLIYLGTLIGILNVFAYFGLDKWIAVRLFVLGDVMRTDFNLFVAILFGVMVAMRFVIPNTATIALCATIFMSIAGQAGINPWVIGFILLSNYHDIYEAAGKTKLAAAEEVIKWTESNSPVPVVGLGGFMVEEGGMFAVGAPGFEQGEATARMAVQVLDLGAIPKHIPQVMPRQFLVYMRAPLLAEHKITLPPL